MMTMRILFAVLAAGANAEWESCSTMYEKWVSVDTVTQPAPRARSWMAWRYSHSRTHHAPQEAGHTFGYAVTANNGKIYVAGEACATSLHPFAIARTSTHLPRLR